MKRFLTTGTNHAIDVTPRRQQRGSGEAGTPPDRAGRARLADLLPRAGSRWPETPARRRCAATARRRAGSTRHEPAARSAKPQKGRVGVLLAGYQTREPFHLPNGTSIWPMWRQPRIS